MARQTRYKHSKIKTMEIVVEKKKWIERRVFVIIKDTKIIGYTMTQIEAIDICGAMREFKWDLRKMYGFLSKIYIKSGLHVSDELDCTKYLCRL